MQRRWWRVEFDDGEVVGRVGADQRGWEGFRVVGQPHLELTRLPDHVGVGDDVALGVEDDTGAERAVAGDLHDRGQHLGHDTDVGLLQRGCISRP